MQSQKCQCEMGNFKETIRLLYVTTATLMYHVNAYVLFAANVDDFRVLAKKFVPDGLAEQLANVVAQTSHNYRREPSDEANDYYHLEYEDDKNKRDLKVEKLNEKRFQKVTPKSYSEHVTETTKPPQLPNIDIDEIVEKVKARLEEEFMKKVTEINRNNDKERYLVKQDIKRELLNTEESFKKPTSPKENIDYREPQIDWKNSRPVFESATNEMKHENEFGKDKDSNLFYEKTLGSKTNDSYEEYDIPKKEYNVYSDEEGKSVLKKEKLKNSELVRNFENVQPFRIEKDYTTTERTAVEDVMVVESDYDDLDKTEAPVEDKARTENILFDYKDPTSEPMSLTEIKDDKTDVTEPNRGILPKINFKGDIPISKPRVGTMIPTRQTYKMSSPNYYAKLPRIAETYNFQEDIPENDRESENLKPVGNPPASINNKVKV